MMTKKWQPYPTYKDSGVEWLGAIPEHWEVKRLKYVCCINPSKSPISNLSLDTEISFVPMEYVDNYGNIDLRETKTLREVSQGYTYFQNKDVIIAKITPCFENGKGALCSNLHNTIGFGSTEFHVIRVISNKTIPEFTYYLTKSTRFTNLGSSELYGVAGQKRVPESFLSNYVTGIPPLPEQQKIAQFLDQETGKIDKLITKKERLIELLKEKRTALISHAVTKGLNPDVPMKDSGVEWLGEIPEHWESLPAFSVVREQNISNKGMLERNLLSLSYGNIIRKDIDTDYGLLPESFETYQIVNRGNIIMRLTDLQNDKRSLRVGLVKERGIITSAYLCLDTRQLISEYAYYLLHSYDITKVFYNMGAGVRQTMKFVDLRRLPILVPDIQEQQKIAQFLDRETSKIDNLITKTRTSIDHLKEYRTALISAAVTGKIDVREH